MKDSLEERVDSLLDDAGTLLAKRENVDEANKIDQDASESKTQQRVFAIYTNKSETKKTTE